MPMETAANRSPVPSISDWDRPLTDQELEAIEAALKSASSSSSSLTPVKRLRLPCCDDGLDECRPIEIRRLPESIASFRQPPTFSSNNLDDGSGSEGSPVEAPNSFKLLPCSMNRLYNFYNRPCRVKLTMKYPEMNFRGRIVYSRTPSEVEKAAMELLENFEAKKNESGQVVLGFDIEWKPTFRRGVPPGKAAVMQICGDTGCCHVMHIVHSGIPHSLQSLIENPAYVKVGVGIANDALKVFADHNVSVRALEDLSCLANQKLGGNPRNWSLASLTEMLICKQLQKPRKIRLGNWETDMLSKEQQQYAATDAYASWYLYQVLKSLPDLADDRRKQLDGASLQ